MRVKITLSMRFTFRGERTRLPVVANPFEQKVFLSGAQRKLMAQGVTVFTYHKLGLPPGGSRDPFLYTKAEDFDRQLAALHENGFQTVRLGELDFQSTENKVAITFDDGFRNAFEHGLKILSRHKTPAIQFIVAGLIGKQNNWDISKGDAAEPLMDAAQIKDWLAAGNEIGSHSITHRNLKKLTAGEAREEISSSKKFLEDKFGREVRHFCYPFGGWTPAVRELVVEAGYASACSVEFGVNDATADQFALRRIIPLSRADLLRKAAHRLVQNTTGR
jgi:peptidoglycan/xylan/chitin deacetylase (PgdA/CDA1 family)